MSSLNERVKRLLGGLAQCGNVFDDQRHKSGGKSVSIFVFIFLFHSRRIAAGILWDSSSLEGFYKQFDVNLCRLLSLISWISSAALKLHEKLHYCSETALKLI